MPFAKVFCEVCKMSFYKFVRNPDAPKASACPRCQPRSGTDESDLQVCKSEKINSVVEDGRRKNKSGIGIVGIDQELTPIEKSARHALHYGRNYTSTNRI